MHSEQEWKKTYYKLENSSEFTKEMVNNLFATLLAIFMQFTHSATSVREKATETLFFYQR